MIWKRNNNSNLIFQSVASQREGWQMVDRCLTLTHSLMFPSEARDYILLCTYSTGAFTHLLFP